MSIFLEEALKLAKLGYLVFQCVPNGKMPFTPTAPKGCNSATSDPDIVRKWWTQYPNCNIGIKCENLLVLDLDSNAELNGPQRFHSRRSSCRHCHYRRSYCVGTSAQEPTERSRQAGAVYEQYQNDPQSDQDL